MNFDFATAGRIVFGAGVSGELGRLTAGLGRRAFLVTGGSPARVDPLRILLMAALPVVGPFRVSGEPTIALVQEAARRARAESCDVVVGIGGGSVLDAAKAVAALIANEGDLLDFLEVIGCGQALPSPAAPCIAVPTTAGTGSEATRNAVLASPERGLKVSLRHASMLPRVALVDPALTLGLSPALTAGTGCDALAQLIEPFLSSRATPLTDGFCRDGLPLVARSLRRAVAAGDDLAARTDMALASLLGGMALANAGLGAVHGLAGPVGGRFPAPHGAVCGVLLAPVMQANLQAATASRFREIARLLTSGETDDPAAGVAWVRRLTSELKLPPLSAYGVREADLPQLAADALQTSSMKSNPVPLQAADLVAAARPALA